MPARQGVAGAEGIVRGVSRILILRPQPGAGETASRARALGLDPIVAPLFRIVPVPWHKPNAEFDALLLTSANAARAAGPLPQLPCYAVGEASASAARAAGLVDVMVGALDGEAALAAAAADGRRRVLHLCGRDHLALERAGMQVTRRIVYAAEAVDRLPQTARQALADGALVLLHSARAAATFAALVDDRRGIGIVAISPAAADAAGAGWRSVTAAAAPRDEALLELATQLCKAAAAEETGRDR